VEVVGKHVSTLYAEPDLKSGLPARTLLSAHAEGICEIEAWQKSKDGSAFRARIVIAVSKPEQGRPGGFIQVTSKLPLPDLPAAHHDSIPPLAEYRRGIPAVVLQNRTAEELHLAVLSSLPAHIAVVDSNGTIIQVNQAWERFALTNGAPPMSKIGVGANYLDVCRRASGENSQEAPEVLAGLSAVLKGSLDSFCLEYPCHSPETQRWFLVAVAPLNTTSTGAVVSHTEITARVVAEQNLKQTSEFFRALIENASDIVAIIDPNGVFRYLSPSIERVLGYGQNELVGNTCFEVTHPADVPRMQEILQKLIATGTMSSPVEFSIRHKQGGWRVLEGLARNAIDNPAVGGIVVTSRDTTERREAESLLREKENALLSSHRALQAIAGRLIEAEETERRRLSRELHDDLNQKLAILAVDAGRLARVLPHSDPQRIENDLRALQSRLTVICGQVRTMAYQLHPSILDDLGLVVAVRSYCAEFSRREGIQTKFLHRNLSRPIPQEHASTIYRITQEALRNVAKHSGANTAFVSLVGSERDIMLTIRDTGKGFRLDEARAHGGLGLTSMEERARILHGTLEVNSRPTAGTTITARIPWTRDNR
jgi:PAS domain S-box-containing protein